VQLIASSHERMGPALHVPEPLHTSDTVQYMPSSHGLPEGENGFEHAPPPQRSSVH
jgi:hypothetical protein